MTQSKKRLVISEELHKKLRIRASKEEKKIQEVVNEILRKEFKG